VTGVHIEQNRNLDQDAPTKCLPNLILTFKNEASFESL
jgi:hypothetical protein